MKKMNFSKRFIIWKKKQLLNGMKEAENEEKIEGNDNRYIMDYRQTFWTDSARECKARGCECLGCHIVPSWFIDRCKMKDCVEALQSDLTKEIDSKYNKEEIEAMYRPKGKSIGDVALHYHVSPRTMRGIMRCLGIELKTRGRHIKQC